MLAAWLRRAQPSVCYLCRRTMGDVALQSRSALWPLPARPSPPRRQAGAAHGSRRHRHLDRPLAQDAAQGLLARYGCDPRRLYEIWEEKRFAGSRDKALALSGALSGPDGSGGFRPASAHPAPPAAGPATVFIRGPSGARPPTPRASSALAPGRCINMGGEPAIAAKPFGQSFEEGMFFLSRSRAMRRPCQPRACAGEETSRAGAIAAVGRCTFRVRKRCACAMGRAARELPRSAGVALIGSAA